MAKKKHHDINPQEETNSKQIGSPPKRAHTGDKGMIRAYAMLCSDTASAAPNASTQKGQQISFLPAAASTRTISSAKAALKKLGFSVVSSSPTHLSIEGTVQQFEDAFASKIKHEKVPKPKQSTQYSTPSRKTVFDSPIEIPADLKQLVSNLTFPAVSSTHLD